MKYDIKATRKECLNAYMTYDALVDLNVTKVTKILGNAYNKN